MATNKSDNRLNELLEQNNDLLKKQLILQLALQGLSYQTIRKMVKCEMNYVTDFLKPLKSKMGPK